MVVHALAFYRDAVHLIHRYVAEFFMVDVSKFTCETDLYYVHNRYYLVETTNPNHYLKTSVSSDYSTDATHIAIDISYPSITLLNYSKSEKLKELIVNTSPDDVAFEGLNIVALIDTSLQIVEIRDVLFKLSNIKMLHITIV